MLRIDLPLTQAGQPLYLVAQANDAPRGVLGANGNNGQPLQGAPGDGTQPAPRPGGGADWLMPVLLLFLAFMVVSMIMSSRKEKKRRAELMASIKKHDRVRTAGGIIGTVAEIRGDELILKVDESSNTRIRFARSAVAEILKSWQGGSTTSEEPEAEEEDRS